MATVLVHHPAHPGHDGFPSCGQQQRKGLLQCGFISGARHSAELPGQIAVRSPSAQPKQCRCKARRPSRSRNEQHIGPEPQLPDVPGTFERSHAGKCGRGTHPLRRCRRARQRAGAPTRPPDHRELANVEPIGDLLDGARPLDDRAHRPRVTVPDARPVNGNDVDAASAARGLALPTRSQKRQRQAFVGAMYLRYNRGTHPVACNGRFMQQLRYEFLHPAGQRIPPTHA